MNYEQMIRETDELVRGIMHRSMIAEVILFSLVGIMVVLVLRLWWKERKIMKASKKVQVVGGNVYVPVVTNDTQVINGVVFHRMGVPRNDA